MNKEIPFIPSLEEALKDNVDVLHEFMQHFEVASFSPCESERYVAEMELANLSKGTLRKTFFGDNSLFAVFEYRGISKTYHVMDVRSMPQNCLFVFGYERV